jgi:hypothetical protein
VASQPKADAAYDIGYHTKRFEEAEDSTRTARADAERDRDYYDGKQLTSDEIAALRKRGQPPVIYNRIQRKVNYLKGLETQTRKDPKAFPRTPGDDGSAQAATDALRYVCDDQDWDAKRSDAYENIIVEGTCAIMVGAAQVRSKADLKGSTSLTPPTIDPELIHIAWDRFYYDPYSRRVDFSDAAYMGIVTWMDVSEAKRKFPGREDAIDSTLALSRDTETYDDRPKHNLWADYTRRRVRVNEEYYLDPRGVWTTCTYTKSGFLIDPEPSPYLDSDGEPESPIKAMSAYVDRDNNRYGEVRAMISPQDEINKRRSKGLHLINSRQLRISRSATAGNGGMEASDFKREFAKPDGIVFAENGEVEVLQTGDMAAANIQLLQEAKAEIDLLGPNAALSGKNENDQSGRAILAQQQGGMVEVALLMDRLRQLSLAVYRSIWARIRQYWDGPRWIRITNDERNLQWVGLNIPKSMLEVAQERLQGDPDAEMKIALLARDPMAQQPVEIQNPVGEMDIDIVLDEGMDTPTVQAEQFDMLTKMLPSMTHLPPEAMELLVTASSLRDKDKLLEIIENMKAKAAQPDPAAQQQQQLMMANAEATVRKTESEAIENMANAEAKRAGIVTDMLSGQVRAADQAARAMQANQTPMMPA